MPPSVRTLVMSAVLALATLGAAGAAQARPSTDLRLIGGEPNEWYAAIDFASIVRNGDMVTVSYVGLFRYRQVDGTDYDVFTHSINCATRTIATSEVGGFNEMGVQVT